MNNIYGILGGVDPDAYQYNWFCNQYRAWHGKLDVVMRQHHRAGEKCFVDFGGSTVPVINAMIPVTSTWRSTTRLEWHRRRRLFLRF